MQYDVNSPAEYMAQLENDWRREKLELVRQMIQQHGPELEEGIEYKMLAYGKAGKSAFHLNAQRNYVSCYIGDIAKVAGGRELLQGFDLGKGCIRIKKSNDLATSGLEEFIQRAIAIWRAGGDIAC